MHSPTGKAQLGTQSRTVVNIIDDDSHLCNIHVECPLPVLEQNIVPRLTLQTTSDCDLRTVSQHSLFSTVLVREDDKSKFHTFHNLTDVGTTEKIVTTQEDDVLSIHLPQLMTEKIGNYKISLYQVYRGGILGTYYSDFMMSSNMKVMERIDKVVNFTWSTGGGHNLWSSIHWKGFIRNPGITEKCCLFQVKGDNVRLWIDQFLVLDEWSDTTSSTPPATPVSSFSAFHDLSGAAVVGDGDHYIHEISLQVRQIHMDSLDFFHDGRVSLSWNASGSMDIVDASYLYAKAS